MKMADLGETWLLALIGGWLWYHDGFAASAIFWAAFIIACKLDSVIRAVYEAGQKP